MAKQTVNLGVAPDGVGGDSVRSGFTKINANMDELYTLPSPAEAEGGSANVVRGWSALRVRQAILGWWDSVTSSLGRNFIAASNEQAARNVLQLTYPATAPTVGDGVAVLREGAGGWLGQGVASATPLSYPASVADITNLTKTIRSEAVDNGVEAFASGIHFSTVDTWGRLRVAYLDPRAWIQGGVATSGAGWTAELYHSGNTLNIGTTPESAREALQLTGEWVDLRPYLKAGFYFESVRASRNSHPRIRKLSCGRVELDGVVNFNETSASVPIGVFVNVPSEFRPTLTAGGLMFGDTATPLSFGAVNWIVTGVDEYSPPQVHGDIMMIPLTLVSPSQGGALSLNGIYWFT